MAKIETLDMSDLIISPKRKGRIKFELKSTSGIHKEPAIIEIEIRNRFQAFMIEAQNPEPVAAFDPMSPVIDEGDIEPP